MKKNVTYVSNEKFLSIAANLGLQTIAQAGFVKIPGPKGRQVYVAKTKRVARIDVSGFEMPQGTVGINNLGGESFGNVHQQLDFARTEDEIIATFTEVLNHMLTLPALEKIGRMARATKKALSNEAPEATKSEASVEAAPQSPEEQRREAIKARAQELIASGLAVAQAVAQAQSEMAAS